MLRQFLTRWTPPFDRVLLVESGARQVFDELLSGLYELYPAMTLDLVTCYAGEPKGWRADRGRVYRVTDYHANRGRLFEELGANRYSVLGIICSGEPVMTKWKWALAFKLPAKTLIFNENCDYFWLDRGHWGVLKHFVLFRAGLAGAGAVRTLGNLILFPFTLTFLLLFAGYVHTRRRIRIWQRTARRAGRGLAGDY